MGNLLASWTSGTSSSSITGSTTQTSTVSSSARTGTKIIPRPKGKPGRKLDSVGNVLSSARVVDEPVTTRTTPTRVVAAEKPQETRAEKKEKTKKNQRHPSSKPVKKKKTQKDLTGRVNKKRKILSTCVRCYRTLGDGNLEYFRCSYILHPRYYEDSSDKDDDSDNSDDDEMDELNKYIPIYASPSKQRKNRCNRKICGPCKQISGNTFFAECCCQHRSDEPCPVYCVNCLTRGNSCNNCNLPFCSGWCDGKKYRKLCIDCEEEKRLKGDL